MIARLLFVFFLLTTTPVHALEANEVMADPALEARAVAIGGALRCVVCQMQSINDSPAPLARDLRLLIRDKLKSGARDEQVIAFVRDRYGDYVLLQPPLQPNTWLLWAAPALFLAVGGIAAFIVVRRGRKA